MHFAEQRIPNWATKAINGELEIGAQLPTRDGRQIGNAYIIRTILSADMEMFYLVLTDAGNQVFFTAQEINELFHPPQWVGDLDEIIRKFSR